MKIIAGAGKGMSILSPKGPQTRPTSGKVREAVMNIMASYLEGKVFVDFFAGTGAMGLEAMSRGAHECVFVEFNKDVIKILNKNISEMKRRFLKQEIPSAAVRVITKSLDEDIKELKNVTADVVWADPPYANAVEWLQKNGTAKVQSLLKEGGLFAVEVLKKDQTAIVAIDFGKDFKLFKEKQYGDTAVVFWQKIMGEDIDEHNET